MREVLWEILPLTLSFSLPSVRNLPAFGSEFVHDVVGGALVYTAHQRWHLDPSNTPPFILMSDSELRQRQPSPRTAAKASTEKAQTSSPPSSYRPAATATRCFILAASLALSVIFLLYFRNFHSPPPATSYVLCSPPGTNQIYTVDHNNSRVECMAVNGKFIIDTGARGKSHEHINLFKTPFMAHFLQPTSQAGIHHTN